MQSPKAANKIPTVEKSSVERRIDTRRPFRSHATVIAGGRELSVRTLDLSRSGVCIVSPVDAQPRMRFRLRLRIDCQLQGMVTFETDVQVMHSVLAASEAGFRVGLQFIQPSPQLISAIARLFAS